MIRKRHSSRIGGHFSCLEAVVVLAVIAVLAALLLPLLGKAQEKAGRVHCANRQRQIVAALHVYAGDSNGSFLPSRIVAGRPAVNTGHAATLINFADAYLGRNYDVFDEPAWNGYFRYQMELYERGQLPVAAGEQDALLRITGYLGAAAHQQASWNSLPGFDPERLGLDPDAVPRRFTAPADWPLVVDAATQALSLAGDPDRRQPPNWWLIAPHFEGGGSYHYAWRTDGGISAMGNLSGANHAYVDGRVEWLRSSRLNAVLHDSPRRMTWWAAAH